jgi:hypothetical protein
MVGWGFGTITAFGNLKEGPIKVGLGFGYYHARPAQAGRLAFGECQSWNS